MAVKVDITQYDGLIIEKIKKIVSVPVHIRNGETLPTRMFEVFLMYGDNMFSGGIGMEHTDYLLPEDKLLELIDRRVSDFHIMVLTICTRLNTSSDKLFAIPEYLYRLLIVDARTVLDLQGKT